MCEVVEKALGNCRDIEVLQKSSKARQVFQGVGVELCNLKLDQRYLEICRSCGACAASWRKLLVLTGR